MTAKEYLEQIGEMHAALMRDVCRLEALRAAASSPPSAFAGGERVQTSPHDKMSDVVSNLVNLDAEVSRRWLRYRHAAAVVASQISALAAAPVGRRVLYSFYIRRWSVAEIADAERKSPRQVKAIKADALTAFEEQFRGAFRRFPYSQKIEL